MTKVRDDNWDFEILGEISTMSEMSEARTILDYLNEDCWREVLQHMSVSDVIRTECVSRRWQRVVLNYLSHIRIGIWKPDEVTHDFQCVNREFPTLIGNVHWLLLPRRDRRCESFESWIYKLGGSVVAAPCDDSIFDIIGKNCYNLKEVMFINLREEMLTSRRENFMRLQRLYFTRCQVSDECIKRYITSSLEELTIERDLSVNGRCLMNVTTALKSLVIRDCSAFSCRHLIAASNNFGGLEKLVLRGISREWNDFHVILAKTPKLELLEFDYPNRGHSTADLFLAICELRKLKHLRSDSFVKDEDLDAVTKCCPELQSLTVNWRMVSGAGLAAVCRNAGPRLTMLGLAGSPHLKDDDVVDCIRACPNLTELNVRHTWLKCGFLPRAAAARRGMRARRPLRLLVDREELHDHPSCPHQDFSEPEEEYEELEFPPWPTRNWPPPVIDYCVFPMDDISCRSIHWDNYNRDVTGYIDIVSVQSLEKKTFCQKMAKIFSCIRRN